MVALPVWISALVLLLAWAAGWSLARMKLRAIAGLGVENALRRMPGLAISVGIALVVLVAALVVVHRAPGVLWRLPFWAQYWLAGLVWTAVAALFAFLAALTSGIAWRTGHPQRRRLAMAAAVMMLAILLPQWSFTRPIADQLRHETERDGTILQSSGSSCVAASGANIARLLGVSPIDEITVARRMGTTNTGTSMPQAVVGMRSLGIECTPADPTRVDPARLALPAFLFVDDPAAGPEGHAIVLTHVALDGRFGLIDPLYGKSLKTRAELDRIWHGLAVGCRRGKEAGAVGG